MATETKLEKRLEPNPVVAKPVDNNVQVSGKDGIPSDSTPTILSSGSGASDTKVNGSAASTTKKEGDQEPHAAFVPPTSSYNYQYPGYSGSFTPLDDHGYYQADGSHMGMQSDNGSMVYYWPSYPYASGTVVGVEGQSVAQQPYFSSSGYLQHPVSYGLETMPCYSWDSTYVGDVSNGNAGFENGKSGSGSTAFAKSSGFNSVKSNSNVGSKFSKPMYTQPARPMTKVSPLGSDFSAGLYKGYQPMGKFPPFTGQKQGPFPHSGPLNYRQNVRMWNGNYRNKPRDRFNRNGDFENQTELTRGPRASIKNAPLDDSVKNNAPLDSSVKDMLGFAMHKEQYNLPDFEIEYSNAKFFVIKSYNEDDIHKSIKYDVWASTPNGNKKLDAAFHNAEEVSSETGTKCPIFLFFSVNGSGQFVGLAEMVGQVDFNKDMDFWQIDKWNGFFPVKWHVIKDIPNGQLRHIVLENNDGHSVTFSRDTQEIGLEKGLEMLNIFKSYSAKTSMLDDFNFYENREKSLNTKKSNKPATLRMEIFENSDFPKHTAAEEKISEDDSRAKKTTNPSTLINLTKNLSLNGHNQKSNSVKKPIGNSASPVPAP
ncbi:YTH domain-containing protein ECT1 isoform X1 [Populus trichocarpa]|uniref:YTH domain-containing protein ECT1 isoform X1 n=1 Tax=Populus trichocarpa TaxID=3694 RepID=UPI000D18AA92|nr:YTH domain-containing protein ECT1 isoform X1 [Populus trichocarpa]|eukprot:XP_024455682.1 YTH domain-containing family protein 1 isoform X1 [Populus trichocarpa]